MPKVVVGSLNPVKLDAARIGFEAMFPGENFEVSGVNVDSGVSRQPIDCAETLQGAIRRAQNTREAKPDADFWVGIEGGIDSSAAFGGEMVTFAWIVILSRDRMTKARTSGLALPDKVVELISQGYELGDADDLVFGTSNSKQNYGAVGILTGNVITRTSSLAQAVELALVPFRNSGLYPIKENE